jgi:hypothetical protein
MNDSGNPQGRPENPGHCNSFAARRLRVVTFKNLLLQFEVFRLVKWTIAMGRPGNAYTMVRVARPESSALSSAPSNRL